MERQFLDFDPGYESVGKGQQLQELVNPEELDEDNDLRAEVYELFVRGFNPKSIVTKLPQHNLKVAQVRTIIEMEREARSAAREKVGPMSIQDAIEYYSRLKHTAEERAQYADDKVAPEFFKIALEAQNRLDKLMGLEGAKGVPLPSDADTAGLGMYKVASRVIREETPALEAGDDNGNGVGEETRAE